MSKIKIIKIGLLSIALSALTLTSSQAETSDPNAKLASAIDKFEDYLNQAYSDLSDEQKTTAVETRIENIDDAIDYAEKGIQNAQVSLKYMNYGSTAVKSEIYTELGRFYAQLFQSEKAVENIADKYDGQEITTDQANIQLTSVLEEVLEYINENKSDYATIIRDVLANQLAVALPSAQASLANLNKSVADYQALGVDTTHVEKYLSAAQTNINTAQTDYTAGLSETDLEKQIAAYNNAAKYLTVAQAQIISAQRALDRLEK